METDFSLEEKRYRIEWDEKWREWCKIIPKLKFKSEWDVKIIPPFGGAIIRFTVDYNQKHCSIYLDCYGRLGVVDKPYWEVYDGEDCVRFSLLNHKCMMEYIEQILM